jgi:DNA-binding XRE family transcriptional regulator
MNAYSELYLKNAADTIGNMMDYAVNDCGLDGDSFLQMFITSGFAEQFGNGNPRVIAGNSGVELAVEIIGLATGEAPTASAVDKDGRTPAYWAGWALAHYQWYTAKSFAAILRALPFSDIMAMYPTLHEADITKFYAVADEMYHRILPETNLRRIREAAGYSQAKLAAEAQVNLRSVQMYEQRNKDINKAQALTLAKIARTLGVAVEDLLEAEK